MTVGSLFAGIGGFDLAASRVWGWDCVKWQVEIDPWARQVLAKHWPEVPRFPDVREVMGAQLEPVDILCGGFPCQDISAAGRGVGIEGERSGLWRELARLAGEIRPRYLVVENVAKLLGRGMGRVLGDLATLGFDAEWHCIPAAAVGAPHIRDRVWIVAYPHGAGLQGLHEAFGRVDLQSATRTLRRHWGAEPAVDRVANGIPRRVDRLRGLGNAIVPQVAETLFRLIDQAGTTP
jgi:DNA (cytosine-5)-methyltransferase 1